LLALKERKERRGRKAHREIKEPLELQAHRGQLALKGQQEQEYQLGKLSH
jgi:hypothetical protein